MSDNKIKKNLDSIFLFYPTTMYDGKKRCFETVYIESKAADSPAVFYDEKHIVLCKIKGEKINILDKGKYDYIKNGIIRLMAPAFLILALSSILVNIYSVLTLMF